MRLFTLLGLLLFCLGTSNTVEAADEPVTLLGTIVKWQYPGSKLGDMSISDAATVNADGKRTVPSSLLKSTMTTEDSIKDVLRFYKKLLSRDSKAGKQLATKREQGRSVVFSNESEGRPFEFHTIVVNSRNASTLMTITRGTQETQTYIIWKRYLRHDVGK